MDEEDLLPARRPPAKKNLAPPSIAELEAYIGELEAEIARARADIAAKRNQRGGAEALFKRT
ncbi:MAG TPA: DUF1192 family protein [Stellaceae bacterium]|jgi:uncharacterized small protein (DUF1192 family)|nr:DUF1192 family protein [Stellaceae bacterium]